MEKREGTPSEDVAYVYNSIADDDKAVDALEQLTMYNSNAITYQASLIMAQTLLLIFNDNDRSRFALVQSKLTETTMLPLWHIQLLFASSSNRQKNLSASIAALLSFRNIENCSLIARMFPRSILRKVDAEKSYTDWEPAHWKEFFALLQNNYNTTTEQWNEECRKELIIKIRATVLSYLQEKYNNGPVKWNREEFQVSYTCLEHKCLVDNYYLTELVLSDESQNPYLKEPVANPQRFWSRLIIRFFEETKKEQEKMILAAMILIYGEYSDLIGECEMLPHFVHLLGRQERHLTLPVVKLVLATVKAEDDKVFKGNYAVLLRADGVRVLLNTACRVHGEKDCRREMTRICCNIVRVLSCILKRKERLYCLAPKARKTFPESNVKIICREKENLNAIVQLLLINSTELRKHVIKLISLYFISDGELLNELGLVDLLVNCLNEATGPEALQLLFKLQERLKNPNADIGISSFIPADQEVIKGDAKIRDSVFLRYLPVCFVRYLAGEVYAKNAIGILLSDEFNEPTLSWSKYERVIFAREVKEHLKQYKHTLKGLALLGTKDLPLYKSHFKSIIKYPSLEQELRCGKYFLRNWIKANGPLDDSDQATFYAQLNDALRFTASGYLHNTEKLHEFLITLKAFDIFLIKYFAY